MLSTVLHDRLAFVDEKTIITHSDLNDFTGLVIAALIAWKLIVAKAIIIAINTAATNIHQLILMRQAKSFSHWFIENDAMGKANRDAINTSFKKSYTCPACL